MVSPDAFDPTRLQPGDVIAGKYRAIRVLGRGGMGTVVAAEHLQLRELVAIKFLLPELVAKADALSRFLREARAVARIQNEHVARVSDVATLEGDLPYIVMEYLEGQDLEAILETRGRLPYIEAVGYLLQACEAVSEAHTLGIVHRDLKPANLFAAARRDGSVCIKVLDFGVSKVAAASRASDLTLIGAVVGSPRYISPERLTGPDDVDTRADIWSLGVILYELLAGVPAFGSDDLNRLFYAICNEEPVPLCRLVTDVPPELETVVARCLRKLPEERYQDVGALVSDLSPLADAEGQGSAQKILRILRRSDPAPRPSLPPESSGRVRGLSERPPGELPLAASQVARTVLAPGGAGQRPRLRMIWGAAGVAGLAVGGLGVWGAMQPSRSPPAAADPVVTGSVPRGESIAPPFIPSAPAPTPACNLKVAPPSCSSDLILDDMEDGDGNICPNGGRNGYWFAYQDGTGTIEPPTGRLLGVSPIPGCRSQSARAIQFKGIGLRDWGAGIALKLSLTDGVPFDLSKYHGVRFWARAGAPMQLQVSVAIPDTLDATYGGACAGPPGKFCSDHYCTRRSVSTNWIAYNVHFSDLAQEGWGSPARLDLTRIVEIQFHVQRPRGIKELGFDVWIDDVTLLK